MTLEEIKAHYETLNERDKEAFLYGAWVAMVQTEAEEKLKRIDELTAEKNASDG